jgi:hypothetical protein
MATDDTILIEAVRKFGIEILIQLTEELLAHDKKASAKLINSLSYDLQVAMPIIFLNITGQDYFGIIEEGARPHVSPLSKIRTWCKFKNIDLKYAYPIQQKIGKFGIAPTPILRNILAGKNLEFENLMTDKYRLWIEGKINDIIKSTN